MKINRLKGMADIATPDVHLWQKLEASLLRVADRYGYSEIRTPIMERTELFARGVGEGSDIVHKEMYSFDDRGGRSVSLRPEGTAAVVRALIENNLAQTGRLRRVFYVGPMFRYERPQKGRMRQFHQYGMEAIGSDTAEIDVEIIAAAAAILRDFGLKNYGLKLNTVGCPVCVPGYKQALQSHFSAQTTLCNDCRDRLERNPLRILDCKINTCAAHGSGIPSREEHICEGCRDHFTAVRGHLDALSIPYTLDERLVRGLDYYTRTAFEFTSDKLGAQDAIGGGGRYNALFAELGGPDLPAVGFAAGMERVLLARLAEEESLQTMGPDVYICLQDQADAGWGLLFSETLRSAEIRCTVDLTFRKLKHQFTEADNLQARFALVIGETERNCQSGMLKNLATREQDLLTPAAVISRVKESFTS